MGDRVANIVCPTIYNEKNNLKRLDRDSSAAQCAEMIERCYANRQNTSTAGPDELPI